LSEENGTTQSMQNGANEKQEARSVSKNEQSETGVQAPTESMEVDSPEPALSSDAMTAVHSRDPDTSIVPSNVSSLASREVKEQVKMDAEKPQSDEGAVIIGNLNPTESWSFRFCCASVFIFSCPCIAGLPC